MVQKIKRISGQLKQYDRITYEHSIRVANATRKISCMSGLQSEMQLLYQASLVHDIGKIFIPKQVLNKPGHLTQEERDVINRHSFLGYQYLIDCGIDTHLAEIVLYHHGEDKIPEGVKVKLTRQQEKCVRILSACDIFDAMVSERPYKKEMDASAALSIMKKENAFDDGLLQSLLVLA